MVIACIYFFQSYKKNGLSYQTSAQRKEYDQSFEHFGSVVRFCKCYS